jgi:DNA-binding NarL/FixJ family response regulator
LGEALEERVENLSEPAGSRRIPRTAFRQIHDVRGNPPCEEQSPVRARVLILEDEAVSERYLVRIIERCGGGASLAGTVREARELLATGAIWTGLIVDVLIPDGCGLDFLREARASGVDVPTLVISGLRQNALAHTAFELSATYLVKPVEDIYVESLVDQASQTAAAVHTGASVHSVMRNWTARYRVSVAESQILLLAAEGHDRTTIAAIRGTADATIKNQVHDLLQKIGCTCLREAVERLLREALHG